MEATWEFNEDRFEQWRMLCFAKEMALIYAGAVGQFIIFLLTLDRFIYIQRPLHYHIIITNKRTIISCTTIWVSMIFIGPVMQPFVLHLKPGGSCNTTMYDPIYFFVVILPFMGILTVANVILYIRIAFVAINQARELSRVGPMQGQQNGIKDKTSATQNKVTRMLGITLGLYFACYIPMLLIGSLKSEEIFIYIIRHLAYLAWYR